MFIGQKLVFFKNFDHIYNARIRSLETGIFDDGESQ